jgi:hypothetical protein
MTFLYIVNMHLIYIVFLICKLEFLLHIRIFKKVFLYPIVEHIIIFIL